MCRIANSRFDLMLMTFREMFVDAILLLDIMSILMRAYKPKSSRYYKFASLVTTEEVQRRCDAYVVTLFIIICLK